MWTYFGGEHGPQMRALLGENVCENKIIGFRKGGRASENLYVDLSMLCTQKVLCFVPGY